MATSHQDERSARDFAPDDEFLRRIPLDCVKPDGSLASKAFANSTNTDRMSVNYALLSSIEHTLTGYTGFGVTSITAELCWTLNQKVERTPNEDNPAHCDVVGPKPQSVRRRFARSAKLLHRPETELTIL